MQFETLITNGDVVTESGIEALDVAVSEGKIAALLPRGTSVEVREVIDAAGALVIPGAIDIHFHCRAPVTLHAATSPPKRGWRSRWSHHHF
ncbi:MAG: hypothetical protein R3E39_26210 [Anaerolineae bacterium]